MVDGGNGDGVYITTAGIGLVPDGVDIRPQRARPGDVVIVSGDIGVHGIAIMSVREGLEFGTRSTGTARRCTVWSPRCSRSPPDIHVLRDPTRGGLARR